MRPAPAPFSRISGLLEVVDALTPETPLFAPEDAPDAVVPLRVGMRSQLGMPTVHADPVPADVG